MVAAACVLAVGPRLASGAASSVRTAPHIVLNEGHSREYNWSVVARRWPAKASHGDPCIDVFIAVEPTPPEDGAALSECGSIERFPNTVILGSRAAGHEITVAGVALDRRVRRIRASLSNGHVVQRIVPLVSKASARAANVDRFRFATFVFQGRVVIHHVLGFDAMGRIVAGR